MESKKSLYAKTAVQYKPKFRLLSNIDKLTIIAANLRAEADYQQTMGEQAMVEALKNAADIILAITRQLLSLES